MLPLEYFEIVEFGRNHNCTITLKTLLDRFYLNLMRGFSTPQTFYRPSIKVLLVI